LYKYPAVLQELSIFSAHTHIV